MSQPALPSSGQQLLGGSSPPASNPHPHRRSHSISHYPVLIVDVLMHIWIRIICPYVCYHCSPTSHEPQKEPLKVQEWDKSNFPKLFSLSLTLSVIFQPFLKAFYFILKHLAFPYSEKCHDILQDFIL